MRWMGRCSESRIILLQFCLNNTLGCCSRNLSNSELNSGKEGWGTLFPLGEVVVTELNRGKEGWGTLFPFG